MLPLHYHRRSVVRSRRGGETSARRRRPCTRSSETKLVDARALRGEERDGRLRSAPARPGAFFIHTAVSERDVTSSGSSPSPDDEYLNKRRRGRYTPTRGNIARLHIARAHTTHVYARPTNRTVTTSPELPIHRRPNFKAAITSKIKHAIKLKTSPARLAQLLQPSLPFCFSSQPMTTYRPGLDGTPSLAATAS